MTPLSSLLASARVISQDPHVHPFVQQFAAAVLELLSDDGMECGMPMPTVVCETRQKMSGMVTERQVVIPSDACGPWSPGDARGFARAVFAVADEAEGASK